MNPDLAIVLFVIAALVGVVILLLMALLRRQEQATEGNPLAGLEEYVLIDPETGLYNLRFFQKKLEEEIYRSARYNAYFTLAVFDFSKSLRELDPEKAIMLLRKLGTAAARDTRFTDIVARIEQFKIALILSMTPKRVADIPVERLRARLAEILEMEGVKPELSYEVLSYPEDKTEVEKLSIKLRP